MLKHFIFRTCGRTIHRPSRKQGVGEHSGAIAAIYPALAPYVKNQLHGVIAEPTFGVVGHVTVKVIVPLRKRYTTSFDRVSFPAGCATPLERLQICMWRGTLGNSIPGAFEDMHVPNSFLFRGALLFKVFPVPESRSHCNQSGRIKHSAPDGRLPCVELRELVLHTNPVWSGAISSVV